MSNFYRFRADVENIINCHDNIIQISDKFGKNKHGIEKLHSFSFDFCFDENTSQIKVFETLSPLVITPFTSGINSCIIAYGQTGSGKTHTMLGTENDPGLIPKICEEILSFTETLQQVCHASFYEVYNEKVRDLLSNGAIREPSKVRVREHPIFGPYVSGLSWHPIRSTDDVALFLHTGCKARSCSLTNMHNSSSRSHAIFTIVKKRTVLPQGDIFGTKMCLVDLAGSEKPKHQSTRAQVKEGAHINKSLATLGNVILSLTEHKHKFNGHNGAIVPDKYIPYRNSTLTWLLKDSIGGTARTVMIGTISTSFKYYTETLNTLRYAHKAKEIVHRASCMIEKSSNSVHLINDLQSEIERLKKFIQEKVVGPSNYDAKRTIITKDFVSRSVMTSPLESVDFPMDDGDSMKDQLLSRYQEKVEDLQSELENYRLLMKGSSLVNGEESPQEVDQDSFASPRPLKYKLEKKVEKLEQKLAEKKDQLANNIHEDNKELESSQVSWWVDYLPAKDSPLTHSWISVDFTEAKNPDRFAHSVPVTSKKLKQRQSLLSETLYPKVLKDANRPTFSFLKKTDPPLDLEASYQTVSNNHNSEDMQFSKKLNGKKAQSWQNTNIKGSNDKPVRYTNSYHFECSEPWIEDDQNKSANNVTETDVEKMFLDSEQQEIDSEKPSDSRFDRLTQSFIHIPTENVSGKNKLNYSYTNFKSSPKTSDRPTFNFLKKQARVESENKENCEETSGSFHAPLVEYGVHLGEFQTFDSALTSEDNNENGNTGNKPAPRHTYFHRYDAADNAANKYVEKCFKQLSKDNFKSIEDNSFSDIKASNGKKFDQAANHNETNVHHPIKESGSPSLSDAYKSLVGDPTDDIHLEGSDSDVSDIGASYKRVGFDNLNTSSATPYGSSFSSQSLVSKEIEHFSPTNFWRQNFKLHFEDDEEETKDSTPSVNNDRSKTAKKVVRARAELRRLRHHSNSSSASEPNSARQNGGTVDSKVKVDGNSGFIYDVNAPSDMASFNGDSMDVDSDKEDHASSNLHRSSIFHSSFAKQSSDDDAESIAEELEENKKLGPIDSLYVNISDVEDDSDIFGTSSISKAANLLDEKLPLSFTNSNLEMNNSNFNWTSDQGSNSGSLRKTQSYVTNDEFENAFKKSLEKDDFVSLTPDNFDDKENNGFKKNFELPDDIDMFASAGSTVVQNSPSKEALVIHVKLVQRTQGTLSEIPNEVDTQNEMNLFDFIGQSNHDTNSNSSVPAEDTNKNNDVIKDHDENTRPEQPKTYGRTTSYELALHKDHQSIEETDTVDHRSDNPVQDIIFEKHNKESDSSARSRSFSSDFESETTVNEVSPRHKIDLTLKSIENVPVNVLKPIETGLTTWGLFDISLKPTTKSDNNRGVSFDGVNQVSPENSNKKRSMSWAWTESHAQKRNDARQKFYEPLTVMELVEDSAVSSDIPSEKLPLQQTKSLGIGGNNFNPNTKRNSLDSFNVHPKLSPSFDLNYESNSNSPQHQLWQLTSTPTKVSGQQPSSEGVKKFQDNLSTIEENVIQNGKEHETNVTELIPAKISTNEIEKLNQTAKVSTPTAEVLSQKRPAEINVLNKRLDNLIPSNKEPGSRHYHQDELKKQEFSQVPARIISGQLPENEVSTPNTTINVANVNGSKSQYQTGNTIVDVVNDKISMSLGETTDPRGIILETKMTKPDHIETNEMKIPIRTLTKQTENLLPDKDLDALSNQINKGHHQHNKTQDRFSARKKSIPEEVDSQEKEEILKPRTTIIDQNKPENNLDKYSKSQISSEPDKNVEPKELFSSKRKGHGITNGPGKITSEEDEELLNPKATVLDQNNHENSLDRYNKHQLSTELNKNFVPEDSYSSEMKKHQIVNVFGKVTFKDGEEHLNPKARIIDPSQGFDTSSDKYNKPQISSDPMKNIISLSSGNVVSNQDPIPQKDSATFTQAGKIVSSLEEGEETFNPKATITDKFSKHQLLNDPTTNDIPSISGNVLTNQNSSVQNVSASGFPTGKVVSATTVSEDEEEILKPNATIIENEYNKNLATHVPNGNVISAVTDLSDLEISKPATLDSPSQTGSSQVPSNPKELPLRKDSDKKQPNLNVLTKRVDKLVPVTESRKNTLSFDQSFDKENWPSDTKKLIQQPSDQTDETSFGISQNESHTGKIFDWAKVDQNGETEMEPDFQPADIFAGRQLQRIAFVETNNRDHENPKHIENFQQPSNISKSIVTNGTSGSKLKDFKPKTEKPVKIEPEISSHETMPNIFPFNYLNQIAHNSKISEQVAAETDIKHFSHNFNETSRSQFEEPAHSSNADLQSSQKNILNDNTSKLFPFNYLNDMVNLQPKSAVKTDGNAAADKFFYNFNNSSRKNFNEPIKEVERDDEMLNQSRSNKLPSQSEISIRYPAKSTIINVIDVEPENREILMNNEKSTIAVEPTNNCDKKSSNVNAKEEYLAILRKFLPLPLVIDETSSDFNMRDTKNDSQENHLSLSTKIVSPVAIVAETNYEDSMKTYIETLGKLLPFSGYITVASNIPSSSKKKASENVWKKNLEERQSFFSHSTGAGERSPEKPSTKTGLTASTETADKSKNKKLAESKPEIADHTTEIDVNKRLPTPVAPNQTELNSSGNSTTNNNNYLQNLSNIFPIPLHATNAILDHSIGPIVSNDESKSNKDQHNPFCFSTVSSNILLRDRTSKSNGEEQNILASQNPKLIPRNNDSSHSEEDVLHVTVIDGVPHVEMKQEQRNFNDDEYDEAIDLSVHSDDEDAEPERDYKNDTDDFYDTDDIDQSQENHIDLDESHPDEILYYFNKKSEKIVDPSLKLPLSRSLDFTETSADSYVPLSNRLSDSFPNVNSDRSNRNEPPPYTPYSNSSISRDSLKLDFKDYFNDNNYNDEDDSDTRRKKSVSWSDLRAGRPLELGPAGGSQHASPLKPIIKRGSITIEPTSHSFNNNVRRSLPGPQFSNLHDSVMVTKSALNIADTTSRDVYVQTDPPPPTRSVSTLTFQQHEERAHSPSPNVSMENLKRYQTQSLLSDLMALVQERDALLRGMNSDLSFWQKPGSSFQTDYGKQYMNDQWWKLWRVKHDLDKRIEELFTKLKSYQLSELPYNHMAWLNVPHSALLSRAIKPANHPDNTPAGSNGSCSKLHLTPFDYERKLADLRRTLVSTSKDLKQTSSYPELQTVFENAKSPLYGDKHWLTKTNNNRTNRIQKVEDSPQSVLEEARKLRELSQSILQETRQSLIQPKFFAGSRLQGSSMLQSFNFDVKSREEKKIDDEIQVLRNQYKNNQYVGRSNYKF